MYPALPFLLGALKSQLFHSLDLTIQKKKKVFFKEELCSISLQKATHKQRFDISDLKNNEGVSQRKLYLLTLTHSLTPSRLEPTTNTTATKKR